MIVAILTALVLIIPAIYTNSIYGYLPIISFSLLLVLAFIHVKILKRHITASYAGEEIQVHKGECVVVTLNINNMSFLVCNRISADVFISTSNNQEVTTSSIIAKVDAKSTTDFSFDMTMEHVGLYEVGIRNVRVYDFLGLFYATIPALKTNSVIVLPNSREVASTFDDNIFVDTPNASSYMENDGFDYTGVREYHIGDSIKKIHWKLSAHSSSYMTKINEVGLKSDVTVFIDTYFAEGEITDRLNVYDKLIETAFSIACLAEEKDVDCNILYLDNENQFHSSIVKNKENLVEVIKSIHSFDCGKNTLPQIDQIIGSNIVACTASPSQELMTLLQKANQERRNAILYYIKDDSRIHDRDYNRRVTKNCSFMEDSLINYETI